MAATMRQSPVRWMVQRDLPDVLDIERLCFPDPWDEKDFKDYLRDRAVIGMVYDAELSQYTDRRDLHGFIVYELHPTKIVIHNLAVHPFSQRRGIGRTIIDKMVCKLNTHRRNRMVADVREGNTEAQLFFKAMGFEAVTVVPERFDDGQNAYRFVYRSRP